MDTKATTPGVCVPTLAAPRETAARKAGGRCKGKKQTLKSKVEGRIGTGAKAASARAVPAATVMILDDIPTSRLLPRTQQKSQFQSWHHQVWMHHTQTRCWQPFLIPSSNQPFVCMELLNMAFTYFLACGFLFMKRSKVLQVFLWWILKNGLSVSLASFLSEFLC